MDPALQNELKKDLHDARETVDAMLGEEKQHELGDISEQFSCLMRSLINVRNHIIQTKREGKSVPDLPSLEEINAMISLMASIEYPRIGIHWERIKQVRDGLEEMISPKQVH